MHPAVLWALRWHLFLAPHLFGFTPRFLSGFRTREEQTALFRHNPSGNPVALPGTSQHEHGFAYDLAPDVGPESADYSRKLEQLRWLGLALGMRWGGPDDPQHWQAFPLTVWQAVVASFSTAGGTLQRGLL